MPAAAPITARKPAEGIAAKLFITGANGAPTKVSGLEHHGRSKNHPVANAARYMQRIECFHIMMTVLRVFRQHVSPLLTPAISCCRQTETLQT